MSRRTKKTGAAIVAALTLTGTAFTGTAGAEPVELFGNGWREAYDGAVHCTTNTYPGPTNQVVCDKIGPGYAWASQGAVELFWPWWCQPAELIGGGQGYAPARIRLGGRNGSVGCALGIYPSSTQAWAAVEGTPGQKTAHAGMLALRPNGIYGNSPTVTMTVERGCWIGGYTPTSCPGWATYTDIVVY